MNNLEDVINIDDKHDQVDLLENYDNLKANNITDNVLYKLEKTTVIGIRAQQLTLGSKPFVKVPAYIDNVIEIAKMELEARKIPFIIRRKVSDKYEYWKLEDLRY